MVENMRLHPHLLTLEESIVDHSLTLGLLHQTLHPLLEGTHNLEADVGSPVSNLVAG